jgi:rubrerythrin
MGEVRTDSTKETLEHIRKVNKYLSNVAVVLIARAVNHDNSKLLSPEKQGFDKYNYRLKNVTYGSDEYKKLLEELKPILEHHYSRNNHHPEHYKLWRCPNCKGIFDEKVVKINKVVTEGDKKEHPKVCPECSKSLGVGVCEIWLDPYIGLNGMNLLDLIEMLMDWKAATERHNNGDIFKSIEINQKRFGYSNELKQIFINTINEIFE